VCRQAVWLQAVLRCTNRQSTHWLAIQQIVCALPPVAHGYGNVVAWDKLSLVNTLINHSRSSFIVPGLTSVLLLALHAHRCTSAR
jgi:hypothetical protein